jgi:hypothetical protein
LQVHEGEGADVVLARHALVIRTEARRRVHHAGTVLGGHEIAADHLEGIAAALGFGIGQQLLVAHALQLVAVELLVMVHGMSFPSFLYASNAASLFFSLK